ncbi:MAG: YbaB/EbfC family nucleoid-associated protein [Mollicutes bacterium]|jgi:DNA-binding YbaB/EbfC family protein|nr:YbaB/EbfC family nucleoid-associated protein [Mollicutes bacterium]
MNMQNLMAQAQKIQKEITKAKEEIDSTIYSSENEFVKIELNGKKELVKISIKKEKIDQDDIEIFEDMVTIAMNECIKKIDKDTGEKMGKYGNSLNGLF